MDTAHHPSAYQVGQQLPELWVSPDTKFPILAWVLELGGGQLVNEDGCQSASQSSFPSQLVDISLHTLGQKKSHRSYKAAF